MKKVKLQFIVCESECEALRIVLERLVLRQLERIDSGIFFFICRRSSLPRRPKFQLRWCFFLYFRSIKNFSAFSKCCHSRFTFNLFKFLSELSVVQRKIADELMHSFLLSATDWSCLYCLLAARCFFFFLLFSLRQFTRLDWCDSTGWRWCFYLAFDE